MDGTMDEAMFAGLVSRARSGEEAAAKELLLHFEADVRLMVRIRLPRVLRSRFDSTDFVQAVWQSFFEGDGPAEFANSAHLRAYLAGVVRNKVLAEYRRYTRTRKYELGREEPLYVRRSGRDEPLDLAAPDPSPSQHAQAGECLDRLLAGRSAREVEVVDLRRQGLTYSEIAGRLGISERSVRRVIEALWGRIEGRRWE